MSFRVHDLPRGGFVVRAVTEWPLLAMMGFAAAAVEVSRREPPRALDPLWVGMLAAGAIACLAALERTVFEFDVTAREVRWTRQRLRGRDRGTIPFAEVTGVSLEQGFTSQGRRSNARRIDLHTTTGIVPLTTGYSARVVSQRAAAERIAAALGGNVTLVG